MTQQSSSGVDILYILAHPDDETFGHAGMMTWSQDNGRRTALVCATRGEMGEISDPSLGTPETLGAAREGELRRAMAIVGTDPVRLLSYRDSGMAGTAGNNDRRSLVQAEHDALLADVVFQIRDLKPHAVVTFGPDGVYGHPDHVRIGEVTTEAMEVAASDTWPFLGAPWQSPRLFHVAVAREALARAKKHGVGFFATLPDEVIATMGIPEAEITHVFDVRPYIETKVRAIASHATQIPFNPDPGSPADPAMRPMLGRESLKRMPLPWDGDDQDFLDELNVIGSFPE